MSNTPEESLSAYLLDLYGPDPYAEVRTASEAHRPEHAKSLGKGEQECGVYPSDALKMHAIATIVRAMGARRVLEIGGGLGYSALWLAEVVGSSGRVDTIDRFPDHVAQIKQYARRFGFSGRLYAVHGEGDAILRTLTGPYDAIHDDGWFAAQPPYYDRLADLLRPGGLLIMSNWFLLEHALSGQSPIDWSQFAGESWADDIRAYAAHLTADSRFNVSFSQRPALALAYKRSDA